MQRVQWDGMTHPEIVRELEAGRKEANLRMQQLMVAAGISVPGKRGPKAANALVLTDGSDDDAEEAEAAQ